MSGAVCQAVRDDTDIAEMLVRSGVHLVKHAGGGEILVRTLGHGEAERPGVEVLALDVELPCRGGDLVVEEVEPPECLGVGELEVPVGAPAGVDLVELGGVEGRAEALQALAVVEAELGGEVVALQQPDVVDAAGERLGRLDLDRARLFSSEA